MAEPVPGLVPGTRRPAAGAALGKTLLLDRDGVVNVDHGYVHTPAQTQWVPGIFALCEAAQAAGHGLLVVTNQAGIARGHYDEAQFAAYTEWLHAQFAQRGLQIAATYYCPHHPLAGQGRYRLACACRKPGPGMLLAAARDYGVDLAASTLIGDKATDMLAGQAAGVGRLLLVGDDIGAAVPSSAHQPVADLQAALRLF